MPFPTAILYHTRLLCLQAANKTQKSNVILWKQGPRFFHQGLNLVYFCIPKGAGHNKVEEHIKTNTQTAEGIERDWASEELLQHGGMWLLAYRE